MNILKTDSIKFKVVSKNGGEATFNSFEKALNYGKSFELCFIDISVSDKTFDVTSGFRSSICKVKNGDVTMIHGHYLTQLAKLGLYDAL